MVTRSTGPFGIGVVSEMLTTACPGVVVSVWIDQPAAERVGERFNAVMFSSAGSQRSVKSTRTTSVPSLMLIGRPAEVAGTSTG